jgi:hypothetical protein
VRRFHLTEAGAISHRTIDLNLPSELVMSRLFDAEEFLWDAVTDGHGYRHDQDSPIYLPKPTQQDERPACRLSSRPALSQFMARPASATQGTRNRIAAIIEVLVAFVFVHVTYRSSKHFTALGRWEGESGLNFLPGLVMILFTVSVLLLCGRNFTAYGLTLNRWRQNLNIGLFWSCTLVGLAGLGLLLTRIHFDPSHPHNNPTSRLAGTVFGVAITVFMLWTFQKRRRDAVGIPPVLSALALVVLLSIPLIATAWQHRPMLPAA